MAITKSVSIEVPSREGDKWLTLSFYTNHILAPNHEPIKVERSGRFTIAGEYQTYLTNTLTKLRFLFYKQQCKLQIQVKTFSHKDGAARPNDNALNLAILMADLHFAGHISLPDVSALEAGFCFTQGLMSISPCAVAPTYQQASDGLQTRHRTSLVYRHEPLESSPYQANFDYRLLAEIKAIVPQTLYQSCVYYPMVDAGQDHGHTLACFTVLYIPSESQSCSFMGQDMTFKFAVNEFIEQNIDLNMILTGHVLIDCGSRPSKGHNSWQLALVSALQIATGLMPCDNKPLICTGQVSRNEPDDHSRAIVAVAETPKKYQYIQTLKLEGVQLMSTLNQADSGEEWYFCLPEKNYYELDISQNAWLSVLPVTHWYYEDLIT